MSDFEAFQVGVSSLGLTKRNISVFGKVCLFYMLEVEKVAPFCVIRFLLLKSALIDYV